MSGQSKARRLAPLLNGVERASFSEARGTEYSKAARRGNGNEVWDSGAVTNGGADRRHQTRVPENVPGDDGGKGMFAPAGVAEE